MTTTMMNSVPYVWSVDTKAPSALLESAKFAGAFDIHLSEQFDQGWTCKKRGTAKKVQLQFIANGQLISLVFKSITQKNFSNRLNIRPYQRASYVTVQLPNHGITCVLFAVEQSKQNIAQQYASAKQLFALPAKANLVGVNPTDDQKLPLLMLNSGKDTSGAHTVVAFFANSSANMSIASHAVHTDNHVLRVMLQQINCDGTNATTSPAISSLASYSPSSSSSSTASSPAMDSVELPILGARKRSRNEDIDADENDSQDENSNDCRDVPFDEDDDNHKSYKSRRVDSSMENSLPELFPELSPAIRRAISEAVSSPSNSSLSMESIPTSPVSVSRSLSSSSSMSSFDSSLPGTPRSCTPDLPDLSDIENEELDMESPVTANAFSPFKHLSTPKVNSGGPMSELEEFVLPPPVLRFEESSTASTAAAPAPSPFRFQSVFTSAPPDFDDDTLKGISIYDDRDEHSMDLAKFLMS